jgi:hypothetical protein
MTGHPLADSTHPARPFRYLPARLARADIFDFAAMVLLAVLVILVFATFRDYAISNDEEVQQRYGELIIDYYRSGFTDQALFHFKNLYLYGGLFDVVVVFLQRLIPLEPYDVRHIFTALIGIGGIAAAWATARMIAGPRAAAFTALALATCASWYGPMFNHTKDVPFGAAMMAATYFLCRIARDLPHPRLRDVFWFGLTAGCALGIRVTGFLLFGYAGLVVLISAPGLFSSAWKQSLPFVWRSALRGLPAFIIAYAIMLAAWPWAALNPLNPIRGFEQFSEFNYNISTLLLGTIYDMADTPPWYVPFYFLVKLPILMLVGIVIATGLLLRPQLFGTAALNKHQRWETGAIAFTVFFPLLLEAVSSGPAFTGIRHFLFLIPPMAVLTGIGLDRALAALEARRQPLAIAGSALILFGLACNVVMLVRLHPMEYIYFNPLIGGLQGAYRQMDTDYWVNSMPEAVQGLRNYLDRTEGQASARYLVGICAERLGFEKAKENDPRLTWTENWMKADFFIAPTHNNCDRVMEGPVVFAVERLGVPIAVVKDRRGYKKDD